MSQIERCGETLPLLIESHPSAICYTCRHGATSYLSSCLLKTVALDPDGLIAKTPPSDDSKTAKRCCVVDASALSKHWYSSGQDWFHTFGCRPDLGTTEIGSGLLEVADQKLRPLVLQCSWQTEGCLTDAKFKIEASILPKASQAGTSPDAIAFGWSFLSTKSPIN